MWFLTATTVRVRIHLDDWIEPRLSCQYVGTRSLCPEPTTERVEPRGIKPLHPASHAGVLSLNYGPTLAT